MANKKITELPSAATVIGTELIECVQGGVNKRLTPNQIAALAEPELIWGGIGGDIEDQTDLVTYISNQFAGVVDDYWKTGTDSTLTTDVNIDGAQSIGFGVAPTAKMHVKSLANTPATNALVIQNSDDDVLFKVKDNGDLDLGYEAGTSVGVIGDYHLSIGYNANSGTYKIGENSIAIGNTAKSKENHDISIGSDAGNTSGSSGGVSVSLGWQANNGSSNIGDFSVAIGGLAKSIGNTAIALGTESIGQWAGDVAIGYRAMKNVAASDGGNVVIGYEAGNDSAGMKGTNVVIGNQAQAGNENSVHIGNGAGKTSGLRREGSVCIGSTTGFGTDDIGEDSTSIGNAAHASNFASIALGYQAKSKEDYAMCISQIDNIYFQTGWGNAPGTGGSGVRLQGGFPIGTDLDASERTLKLAAARATGDGVSGDIIFEYSPAGSSGATLQTLTEAARMYGPTGIFEFQKGIILPDLGDATRRQITIVNGAVVVSAPL